MISREKISCKEIPGEKISPPLPLNSQMVDPKKTW